MAHVRAQLRDAIVAALGSVSAVSGRVYSGRVHPVAEAQLPCLCVYVRADRVTDASLQPVRQDRSIEVVVEAIARATSDLDATLDALCVEVEDRLLADPKLGGLAKYFGLDETTLEIERQAEQPVGVARLVFTARVHTRAGSPELEI